MDSLLIYSQKEEEHLKHLELAFGKFRKACIKLKCQMRIFKKEIEYLRHLVSGEGISPVKQNIWLTQLIS